MTEQSKYEGNSKDWPSETVAIIPGDLVILRDGTEKMYEIFVYVYEITVSSQK